MIFLTTDLICSAVRKGNFCTYFCTSKTHGVGGSAQKERAWFDMCKTLGSIHVFPVYNWHVKFFPKFRDGLMIYKGQITHCNYTHVCAHTYV